MCCLIYKFLLILTQKMQISFLKILPENALKFVSKKMRICVKNFAQLHGKSTFLRLIGKLQEGTYQGNIRINGILLEEINMDSLYGKMGIVFQEPYLFGFSLKENIIMGRNVKDSDYEAILKKLNLGYLLERFSDVELDTEMVAKLSGGEKQRIALARAMVGKPQVYLLDEITSSLDEQNAREMEEILLAEDAMVLYVCHKIIPELKGQYEMLTF